MGLKLAQFVLVGLRGTVDSVGLACSIPVNFSGRKSAPDSDAVPVSERRTPELLPRGAKGQTWPARASGNAGWSRGARAVAAVMSLVREYHAAFGICIAVSICVFIGCAAGPPSSPADRIRDDGNDRLIVFLHGVFGNQRDTWRNAQTGAYWPELIVKDRAFGQFNVYSETYDSASTLEEVAQRLLQRLRDRQVFARYRQIYFVGHSQGGLVIKRMLNMLNRPLEVTNLRRVRAAIFLGTPAQGSGLAGPASSVSRNPQLRDLEPADRNSFLQAVENEWQDLLRGRDIARAQFPRSFCAYETRATMGVKVVSRIDAATGCDGTPYPIDVSHSDLAKPRDMSADPYPWVRMRIIETAAMEASVPELVLEVQGQQITVNTRGLRLGTGEVKRFLSPRSYHDEAYGILFELPPQGEWREPEIYRDLSERMRQADLRGGEALNALLSPEMLKIESRDPWVALLLSARTIRVASAAGAVVKYTADSSEEEAEERIQTILSMGRATGREPSPTQIAQLRESITFSFNLQSEFSIQIMDKRPSRIITSLPGLMLAYTSQMRRKVHRLVANSESILAGTSAMYRDVLVNQRPSDLQLSRWMLFTETKTHYFITEIVYSPQVTPSIEAWEQLKRMLDSFRLVEQ